MLLYPPGTFVLFVTHISMAKMTLLRVLRLSVDVRVHQSPDIAGHRDAKIGSTGDNNLFVASGKPQRTLPVTVAICLIPLPVRLFTSNTECHKIHPPIRTALTVYMYTSIVLMSVQSVKVGNVTASGEQAVTGAHKCIANRHMANSRGAGR